MSLIWVAPITLPSGQSSFTAAVRYTYRERVFFLNHSNHNLKQGKTIDTVDLLPPPLPFTVLFAY